MVESGLIEFFRTHYPEGAIHHDVEPSKQETFYCLSCIVQLFREIVGHDACNSAALLDVFCCFASGS